ncbi:MAG: phage head closure protein [Bacillota bacterium]|nr:MAG: head-tail adaptor protein [Bacillota bacterium]
MITHLLNRVVTIERKTRTHDGQGGWKEGWQVVGTIRARVRPSTARERSAVAIVPEAIVTHVLYTEYGADIRRDDRVTLEDGTRLKVVAVLRPSAGHHLEVQAEEVQHGR